MPMKLEELSMKKVSWMLRKIKRSMPFEGEEAKELAKQYRPLEARSFENVVLPCDVGVLIDCNFVPPTMNDDATQRSSKESVKK